MTVAVIHTIAASANVTMMWLVTAKEPGNRLMKLRKRMKMKIEKIQGKYFIPSSPRLSLTMPATYSYVISARDCTRDGISERERIAKLCDDDTFREFGSLTGKAKYDDEGELAEFTPANSVVGSGQVNGRHVCVAADDFTIRGGSSEAANPDKWVYLERLALETGGVLVSDNVKISLDIQAGKQ